MLYMHVWLYISGSNAIHARTALYIWIRYRGGTVWCCEGAPHAQQKPLPGLLLHVRPVLLLLPLLRVDDRRLTLLARLRLILGVENCSRAVIFRSWEKPGYFVTSLLGLASLLDLPLEPLPLKADQVGHLHQAVLPVFQQLLHPHLQLLLMADVVH